MPELVALQTMLPKIESPFEAQGKALQLRQLLGTSQDADYERQMRAQAAQDDASYRQALQANPKGGEGLLSALAGSGNVKGYAAAQKADLDARKATSDIGKTDVETKAKQLDTLIKANGLIGSAAGALKANPTFDNATAIVGQLRQSVGPELAAQMGLDSLEIPRDSAAITQWAQQHYLAAIDADKQLSDARTAFEGNANRVVQVDNSKRSAAASKYSADSSAGTARARLNYDKEKDASKTNAEPSLSPDTIQRLARQGLRGDRTGLANMGRGAQGAANLVAVQNAMTAEGSRLGMTPEDITARSAELEGLRTGMRATGNISARVENAIAEADQLMPLALESSAAVSRSGLLPFGKAQIMFNTQTNNPDLARFAAANTGLATAYASAMARGNKPTVTDMEHARALLSEAKDQVAYAATIGQMKKEMAAASAAPKVVRDALKGEIDGRGGHGSQAVSNPFTPSAPKTGAVVDGYRFKGGDPAKQSNWEKQ